jgi:hypothetical protein
VPGGTDTGDACAHDHNIDVFGHEFHAINTVSNTPPS